MENCGTMSQVIGHAADVTGHALQGSAEPACCALDCAAAVKCGASNHAKCPDQLGIGFGCAGMKRGVKKRRTRKLVGVHDMTCQDGSLRRHDVCIMNISHAAAKKNFP